MTLFELYYTLLEHYGPQGWWPLISFAGTNPTLRGRLTGYHPGNYDLPATEMEILEVMVGTILAQNTSWINAEKALFALHERELISIEKLASINGPQLAEIIRPARFYNQKTTRVHDIVKFLQERPITDLLGTSVEELRPQLRAIKGVGNETCDSILLYALKKPIFVVDAYTKRWLARCGIVSQNTKYEEVQFLFHAEIPQSVETYNEFHALIVQHSVHCCKKVAQCEGCPQESDCIKNTVVPRKKKKRGKKSPRKRKQRLESPN